MNDNIAALKKALPTLEEIAGSALIDKKSEYASPCPVCGGDDRFFWKKDADKGYCRQCAKPYDVIDIARLQTGKTIPELLEEHGISSGQKKAKPRNKKISYAWNKATAGHEAIARYFSARNIIFDDDFPVPSAIRYSSWSIVDPENETVC